jgi:hypothetical protein
MTDDERLREAVAKVMSLLVTKDYEELVHLTEGVRLSASEIAQAGEDYGRTLVVPPVEAVHLIDSVQIRGAQPPRWSVTVPVWTAEEGRSDLSLELTVTDLGDHFGIELDDLHVL